MLLRRAGRLPSLLLAAVVIGGWLGVPAADVLLYHRNAETSDLAAARLAERGSALPHALRCALGSFCPGPRLPATLSSQSATGRVQEHRVTPPAPITPRWRSRAGTPQPRAPPTSSR